MKTRTLIAALLVLIPSAALAAERIQVNVTRAPGEHSVELDPGRINSAVRALPGVLSVETVVLTKTRYQVRASVDPLRVDRVAIQNAVRSAGLVADGIAPDEGDPKRPARRKSPPAAPSRR